MKPTKSKTINIRIQEKQLDAVKDRLRADITFASLSHFIRVQIDEYLNTKPEVAKHEAN